MEELESEYQWPSATAWWPLPPLPSEPLRTIGPVEAHVVEDHTTLGSREPKVSRAQWAAAGQIVAGLLPALLVVLAVAVPVVVVIMLWAVLVKVVLIGAAVAVGLLVLAASRGGGGCRCR